MSKTKLFLYLWLWAGFGGIVVTGMAALAGADGILVWLMIVLASNLIGYITAILVGKRYVKQRNQDVANFLAKSIPLSIAAFLGSVILSPLLLFGSLTAAFIVTSSIQKLEQPPAPTDQPML